LIKLFANLIGFGVLALLIVVLTIFFGPREKARLTQPFDRNLLAGGVENYLAAREANVPNLRAGQGREVIWAGARETKTPLAVVYIHGFSASKAELRPVPDQVATALGANLFYTRLPGHGRDGAAMGDPTASDWLAVYDETMAIATTIGERVLVISTSTGSTLATAGLVRVGWAEKIAGHVMVSPNFGIPDPAAKLANLMGFRLWGPMLAGSERSFEPLNDAQAQYWTTRYPLGAVVPMMRLIAAVDSADYSTADMPALFIYSDQDQVVDPKRTEIFMKNWGGKTQRFVPDLREVQSDAYHVIAGDIIAPEQTDEIIAAILAWAQGL